MKKASIVIIVALAVGLLAAPALRAERGNDFQAIQKAVKQNPAYEAGKEVRWLKVLITDKRSGKNKLKISLPISIVELLVNCSGERHLNINDDNCEVDFKALFAELKKAGPTALIEITDDDALIKVWLE
jgi:hypothetical protein